MTKSIDLLSIKENALNWIESLRVKNTNYGVYRYCKNGNTTIMASCFALLTRHLLNDLDLLSDKERCEWVEYIKSTQDSKTGLFIDPLFNENDLHGKHDKEYILHQNTMFCLFALNILDAEPNYRIKIIDSSDKNTILNWLDKLNWSKPWLISNNIMYMLYFLQNDWVKNKSEKSLQLFNLILDRLDELQDPNTGYWGTNKGANILDGMAGAFHFYFFYFSLHRHIFHPEKIIDHTLALQNEDGLFTPIGGGGNCEDLDAIDILVKFSSRYNYESYKIEDALIKAAKSIIQNQNIDGGFCYAKIYRYNMHHWLNCFKLLIPMKNLNAKTRYWMFSRKMGSQILFPKIRNWTWSYSSWTLMRCKINQSDMWSTYFRILALALISSRYPDSFVKMPLWKFVEYGMGWHSNDI